MNRFIVGLVGFKGSGKDTVGNYLHKKFGLEKTSFAEPVKKSLAAMFDWPEYLLEGITDESRMWRETEDEYWTDVLNRPITPRTMMQEFATEMIRNRLHKDFWTLRCRKTIENTSHDIVVTDLRFKNEIQMIRDFGGIIVWVKNPKLPDHYNQSLWYNNQNKLIQMVAKPFMKKMNKIHISERDWIGSKIDYVIENDSTLSELEYKVDKFYNLL